MKTDAYKAWTVGRFLGGIGEQQGQQKVLLQFPALLSALIPAKINYGNYHHSWAVQISQGTLRIPGPLVWRGGEGRSLSIG